MSRAQPSRVDASILASLRALSAQTSQDLLGRLIDAYCDSSSQLLAEISSSLVAGDAVTLRRAAHTLKSGSASLGALGLAELAQRLELQAREGILDGAPVLAAPLPAEVAAVIAELRRIERRP